MLIARKPKPFKPCQSVQPVAPVLLLKPLPAPTVDAVEAKLQRLEPDVRATILGWMAERDLGSETARLEYIGDAVMAIRASLRCGNKCCAGKSREERLENAK